MASIQGTAASDTLVGTTMSDTLVGLAGADRLDGLDGDDVLASNQIGTAAGGARIAVDPGSDADTLTGGAGDDLLFAGYGDTVDGGTGTNILSLDLSSAASGARLLLFDLLSGRANTGANGSGTLSNIAAISFIGGSDGADVIYTFANPPQPVNGRTTILGLGGNDSITAGLGTDLIAGGDGDDVIYGAGSETIYGDDGNDNLTGFLGLVYGGAGDDNLRAGNSTLGVATLYGGAGNDALRSDSDFATIIYGEDGNDGLTGGRGEDSLYGGLGADIFGDSPASDLMVGGLGNDIYFARSDDRIVEGADEGADVVYGVGDFVLAEGIYVETITTLSQYLARGQALTGNSLSQELLGDQGANMLIGSTIKTLNGDTIRGFAGADTMYGNDGRDLLDGGDGNDVMLGGAGDDTLIAGAGDDTVNGGMGADQLEGGAGNDTYLVDSGLDRIVEERGGGVDTVYAVNSYALGLEEVENFAAATATSTTGITLSGNQFGQAIAGTYGSDILIGGGGSVNGGDILIGLRGDDFYTVDAPNVLLIEAFGTAEGNDTATILASGSGFVLNGDSYVETLAAAPGTDAINITGNLLSQRIVGNAGNNVLSTGGGGVDTLDGGQGNDTYRVHGTVSILDDGGTDILYTSGSFRLFTNAGIEAISTAVQARTEAIDLTGNEVAQTVVGNFGTNILDGRGGNDTLVGLAGPDTFAFTTALGTGNVDTIQDFVSGSDRIGLASDVFAAVTAGGITAGEFVTGTAATSAESRLLYDQASGRLFYDADANGAGAAVLFAQLAPNTALAVSDFVALAPVG